MNLSSALHVKAERVGADTALEQIVRLVESAQMAKAPVQKFADHVGGRNEYVCVCLYVCVYMCLCIYKCV